MPDYEVTEAKKVKDKAAVNKRAPKKPQARGDCYEAAVLYVIGEGYLFGKAPRNVKIVHGEMMGQGPLRGITYGHAWVLEGGMVIDQSNGGDLWMSKAAYYSLGRIDEIGNIHEYTIEQVRRKMMATEVYGPWDLVTTTGL